MGGIAQFTCCWAISLRLLSRASSGLPAPYRAWKRETYRATSIDRVADNTGLDTATNTAANATNTWQLLRLKRPLRLVRVLARPTSALYRFFSALSFSESPLVSSGFYQRYFELEVAESVQLRRKVAPFSCITLLFASDIDELWQNDTGFHHHYSLFQALRWWRQKNKAVRKSQTGETGAGVRGRLGKRIPFSNPPPRFRPSLPRFYFPPLHHLIHHHHHSTEWRRAKAASSTKQRLQLQPLKASMASWLPRLNLASWKQGKGGTFTNKDKNEKNKKQAIIKQTGVSTECWWGYSLIDAVKETSWRFER